MHYQESGWLFQKDGYKNILRDVSEEELFELVRLADEEYAWSESVRREVERRDSVPFSPGGYFLDLIRLQNTNGTILPYPYGDIVTFSSSCHFYRGETEEYPLTRPTLNRIIDGLSPVEQELYRAVENMRIEQFCKFLWKLDIVPFWEAKVCDVNYKALAQHYGFKTQLLDLTNDFRNALFFATCKYDENEDAYFPLTRADIEKDKQSAHGIIFHSPNWQLDFFQPDASFRFGLKLQGMGRLPSLIRIDDGILDGIAFQIGFQPLMRCHSQSGYLFPMRTDAPLQSDVRFEKLRFRQTPELSQKVYEMMEGGKKVFPNEGISKAKEVIVAMRNAVVFSEDDLRAAYEYWGADTRLFPTQDDLRKAVDGMETEQGKIRIVKEEPDYPISGKLLQEINAVYNAVDIWDMIGGKIFMTPEQRRRREERCIQIYGELI